MPAQLRKIFLLILLCINANAFAQQGEFPQTFYNRPPAEQLSFLRKIIKDSMDAGSYANVPRFIKMAMPLAAKLPNDTVTGKLNQYLGDIYSETDPDSALYYYRASLYGWKNISLQSKLYLLQSLVDIYAQETKKDSTAKTIIQLQAMIRSLPDTNHKKLLIVNSIAKAFVSMSKYEEGIENYRFILKYALIAKDSQALRNGFVNAGNAYNQTGNDRMAIYYTMQAIPYLQGNKMAGLITYMNVGGYFATIQNIDSSIIFYDKASAIAKETGDESVINNVDMQRANIFVSQGKFAEAESLLKKALSFYEKQPHDVEIVNTLLVYAGLDTSRKDYPAAKDHLLRLKSITKNGMSAFYGQALEFIVTVYEKLGDYKNAYENQKEFMAIKDSIRSDKVQESFAKLQTEYETYKKEEQIKILQSEAQIRELQLKTARRNTALYFIAGILLVGIFAVVWYVRNVRNKAQMGQLKAELEMKALRSQMNPHFIFNSLNSVQKYIWENKQEDAAEYLTKFARLIRLVLENSQHAMIPLSGELDALRLYIEMEHRRNNGKFDYSITTSEHIDTEHIMIPPLLLQPYAENAIWHGLSRKESRGSLNVHIDKKGDQLLFSIDDDGIGRTKAAEYDENRVKKKSMALNISAQRLAWLENETGKVATAEIIDKTAAGIASGTTVIINLPVIQDT